MAAQGVLARLAVGAALCAATGAALAQIYQWTDDKGRTHYGSAPPPQGAKDVQKKNETTGAETRPGGQALPFAVQQAQKDFPVTLYTTSPGCDACDAARALLNQRGIPFKEVSITEDSQIEQLKAAVGSNSVPAMVVGRIVQKGFEAGAYNRALDSAGYPREGVLPPRQARAPAAPGAEAPAPKAAAPQPPAAPHGRYSIENLR